MKKLILTIIVAILTTPVQAKTIQAVATDVLKTYGVFSLAPGGTALDETGIETIFSDNHASLISTKTADAILMSTPAGTSNYVVMDLGFGSSNVITGSGADLVIFSEWFGEGTSYNFGLQAFDSSDTLLSNFEYTVDDKTPLFSTDIAATSINLFNGNSPATMLADDIEIGYIRLFIGEDYNGGAGINSNIALAGAYHVAAVPIPLPIILFASGLTLLGWIGRRKHS